MANTNSLRPILERNPLRSDGANYSDWLRNLRNVLRRAKKEYVLTTPLPEGQLEPPEFLDHESSDGTNTITLKVKNPDYVKLQQHLADELDVATLLIAIMDPELQRRFEGMAADKIIQQLADLFAEQLRVECYNVLVSFVTCKMAVGSSVSAHMLKMMSYAEQLERLGEPLPKKSTVNIVLNSLPHTFNGFVSHYHMTGMEKTLCELHGLLRSAEVDYKKAGPSNVLTVSEQGKKIKKGKRKPRPKKSNKDKGVAAGQPKVAKVIPADAECYECHGKGHWRRDCPQLKTNNPIKGPGVYVFETHIADISKSWILDSGSGAHIICNVQALRNRRKLKKGDIQLRVGNGAIISATDVGDVDLSLLTGLILHLSGVYFCHCITKNIISVSRMGSSHN